MRIGIISDIHGNLAAFESVLSALQKLGADRIYCLGDTVGYGPFPNECIDLVREHCVVVLKGNHDSGLTGETEIEDFNQYGLAALLWSRDRVTPENFEFLRSLPLTGLDGELTLVHAAPLHPEDWPYVLTLRSARANFGAFTTRRCFIGHTHVPVVINEDLSVGEYRKEQRVIVNVGSVGQPRDGIPASSFALYDVESEEMTIIRVPYDIQRTAEAILKTGLPEYLAQRLFQGV